MLSFFLLEGMLLRRYRDKMPSKPRAKPKIAKHMSRIHKQMLPPSINRILFRHASRPDTDTGTCLRYTKDKGMSLQAVRACAGPWQLWDVEVAQALTTRIAKGIDEWFGALGFQGIGFSVQALGT